MNNKIPLHTLSESLAAQTGVSTDDAQKFIKDLFAEVADQLADGQQVEIKGIGRFTAIQSATSPIKFSPDRALAEELNAPFAMFEATEIADDITPEDINSIATPELPQSEPIEEELPTLAEEKELVAIEDEKQPVATDDKEEELNAIEDEELPVAVEEEMPVIDESTTEEVQEEMNEEEPAAEEPIASVVVPIIEEEPVEETPVEEEPVEETLEEEAPIEEAVVEETVAEVPQPSTTYTATIIPEDEEEYVEYHNQPKSRFGLGFFLGLVSGLVIAAIALVVYVVFFTANAANIL